jgi:hypothetical protein
MGQHDPGDESDFHDVAGANVRGVVLGTRTDDTLAGVRNERERQMAKWGEQNHDPGYWNAVLGEEYGEASEAALDFMDLGPLARSPRKPGRSTYEHYRKELIEVAAVAVAMIEQIDRERDARGRSIANMSQHDQEAWRRLMT